ncbi:hypothetical protein GUJ93_ZPchr0406g33337 [Zizania palustris]|uniref:Uncharacterized protein n=1 Tax=Zizania palustris TaxID=103762 RepID=A0A8J5R2M8_ZIZPA|nr:hypothetical protein GUJ93_ZPchr0406g33337 [Zizania palustris]
MWHSANKLFPVVTCSNADYTITFCSNRKQSVCSYHNNRLICSGSSTSWAIMSTLISALLFTFLVYASQFSV